MLANSEFLLHVYIYISEELFNQKLLVKRTQIQGCQFSGLFANEKFRKGEIVCKYVGDKLRTVKAMRLNDKSYLMRLGEQCYIDANFHPTVYARYINDCINPKGWNVEFIKQPLQSCALVVALRDILPGEELFVNYGKRYWVLQKPIRISDEDIQQFQSGFCN